MSASPHYSQVTNRTKTATPDAVTGPPPEVPARLPEIWKALVLSHYRSPGGQAPSPEASKTRSNSRPSKGAHRLPPPTSALRGKVVIAAVAAGAFAAAAAGQTLQASVATAEKSPDVTPLANAQGASAALGLGGDSPPGTPLLLPVATHDSTSASAEVQKLTESAQITQERVTKELEAAKK